MTAVSSTAAIISVIQTLLGSDINGISPPPLPLDPDLPYVTVHSVLAGSLESHDGDSHLTNDIIQANVWSKDFEQAALLRDRIADFFSANYQGSPLGLVVQGTNHRNNAYLYDGTRELHQQITRISVWYES